MHQVLNIECPLCKSKFMPVEENVTLNLVERIVSAAYIC